MEAERRGRDVRYAITDPDVLVACELMRRVLRRRLTRLADLTDEPVETTGAATVTA